MPKHIKSSLNLAERCSDTSLFSTSAADLVEKHYNRGYFKPSASSTVVASLPAYRATNADRIEDNDALPHNLCEKLSAGKMHIVSSHALQRWDGYVVEVGDDTFTARLTDRTSPQQADSEEAEIPLDDLDDHDRKLIEPGKLFYWSIGYDRSPAGTKTRFSRIKLRQLPKWTAQQIKRAEEEADLQSQELCWE